LIDLDKAPLKEPGMLSWQIFLSESQERMVLSADPAHLSALQKLADIYETELSVLGTSDGTGILKVQHHGRMVCELDCGRLHEAPRLNLKGTWNTPVWQALPVLDETAAGADLKQVLGDFAIVSREPVIREYDHEVQGNTVLKPLAGATGDAPQDGSVIRLDGSSRLIALGLSLLPEWGKTDPYAMGLACMDECVRSLVICGANPDKIAVLDNYCMGNPHDPVELGGLVESARALAEAAVAYGTPFVSGKDSFYNYFQTEDGPVSIPVTALISGMGIVEDSSHVTGASLRSDDSVLVLVGAATSDLGGSVYARQKGLKNLKVPVCDPVAAMALYRCAHEAIKEGLVLSAHDVSEGGLAVTLAEMAFSMKAGIEADLARDLPAMVQLFSESPARFVLEIPAEDLESVQEIFAGQPCAVLGSTTGEHRRLVVRQGAGLILDEPLVDLKAIWQGGLAAWY
jgi:phosphoribosylformylglycinamidine synthase